MAAVAGCRVLEPCTEELALGVGVDHRGDDQALVERDLVDRVRSGLCVGCRRRGGREPSECDEDAYDERDERESLQHLAELHASVPHELHGSLPQGVHFAGGRRAFTYTPEMVEYANQFMKFS